MLKLLFPSAQNAPTWLRSSKPERYISPNPQHAIKIVCWKMEFLKFGLCVARKCEARFGFQRSPFARSSMSNSDWNREERRWWGLQLYKYQHSSLTLSVLQFQHKVDISDPKCFAWWKCMARAANRRWSGTEKRRNEVSQREGWRWCWC